VSSVLKASSSRRGCLEIVHVVAAAPGGPVTGKLKTKNKNKLILVFIAFDPVSGLSIGLRLRAINAPHVEDTLVM
jgi:hypothetical protein